MFHTHTAQYCQYFSYNQPVLITQPWLTNNLHLGFNSLPFNMWVSGNRTQYKANKESKRWVPSKQSRWTNVTRLCDYSCITYTDVCILTIRHYNGLMLKLSPQMELTRQLHCPITTRQWYHVRVIEQMFTYYVYYSQKVNEHRPSIVHSVVKEDCQ